MANTKPLASQIKYGNGTTVSNALSKSVLSYENYESASTTAATLPDGQEIEAPNADGLLSRFGVQSGALVFKNYAPGFDAAVNVRWFGASESATGIENANAMRAAADFAAATGRPLYADGVFNYDATVGPVVIRSQFDFGSARIVCRNVASGTYGDGLWILRIVGSPLETLSVNTAELYRGATYIPSLADKSGFLKLTSERVTTVRQLGSTRTDVLQGEPIEVTNGYLSDDLLFGYTSAAGVIAKLRPNDPAIQGILPYFDLTGAWIAAPVRVERNNVTLSKYDTNNVANSYLNIDVADCSNFVLTDVFTPTLGAPSQTPGATASYVCTLTYVYNSLFERVHNQYGWDAIDGNYIRRHLVKDSTVVSFGGHSMSADQELRDSTVINSIQTMGYGYLRFKNITHYPSSVYSGSYITMFLQARLDYGPHYEGTLEIDGLHVVCPPTVSRYIVFRDEYPLFDHGAFVSRSPEQISIKNVTVEYHSEADSNPTSNVFVVFAYQLNSAGSLTYLPSKRMPAKLSVSNIKVKPAPFNTTNPSSPQLRVTDQGVAIGASWTSANFVGNKIRIEVKDCPVPVQPSQAFTERIYYPVNTFDVEISDVSQEIRIDNSDFMGVRLTSQIGVDAVIRNSKQSSTFQRGFTRNKVATNSFTYSNVEMFGMSGATNDATYGYDAALMFFNSRIRFPARMYNLPTTVAHPLGYGAGFCVVASRGNLVDAAVAGGLETYNGIITRLTNDYTDTTYFYKP